MKLFYFSVLCIRNYFILNRAIFQCAVRRILSFYHPLEIPVSSTYFKFWPRNTSSHMLMYSDIYIMYSPYRARRVGLMRSWPSLLHLPGWPQPTYRGGGMGRIKPFLLGKKIRVFKFSFPRFCTKFPTIKLKSPQSNQNRQLLFTNPERCWLSQRRVRNAQISAQYQIYAESADGEAPPHG